MPIGYAPPQKRHACGRKKLPKDVKRQRTNMSLSPYVLELIDKSSNNRSKFIEEAVIFFIENKKSCVQI